MFSLLSFSFVSTGCRSSGGGVLKGLGLVSLVTVAISTGGAGNLAFAANVRGAAKAEINPQQLSVRVYDLKNTGKLLFEIDNVRRIDAETLECDIENQIEIGKEYIFEAYHKIKKASIMRAAIPAATDNTNKVEVNPESEIMVQVYEAWKEKTTLPTEEAKSFKNFENNLKSKPIDKKVIEAKAATYADNIEKWAKNEVTTIEKIDEKEIEEIADEVGNEDYTGEEGTTDTSGIDWDSGEKLTKLPSELKDIKWIDATASNLILGHFEMVYKYNNDHDVACHYEETSWLKLIGDKPFIEFNKELKTIKSFYFDDEVLERYAANHLTAGQYKEVINLENRTINFTQELNEDIQAKLQDDLFNNHLGSYVFEDGLIVYSEFPEEGETVSDDYMLVKFGKLGEDVYCYAISGRKAPETKLIMGHEDEFFHDEDIAYDIFKLTGR